jgi:hypothetical protein
MKMRWSARGSTSHEWAAQHGTLRTSVLCNAHHRALTCQHAARVGMGIFAGSLNGAEASTQTTDEPGQLKHRKVVKNAQGTVPGVRIPIHLL